MSACGGSFEHAQHCVHGSFDCAVHMSTCVLATWRERRRCCRCCGCGCRWPSVHWSWCPNQPSFLICVFAMRCADGAGPAPAAVCKAENKRLDSAPLVQFTPHMNLHVAGPHACAHACTHRPHTYSQPQWHRIDTCCRTCRWLAPPGTPGRDGRATPAAVPIPVEHYNLGSGT